MPSRGAYFRDPNYNICGNDIHILRIRRPPWILIGHLFWQMGGSRCVRNAPTKCGSDWPILLRNLMFNWNCTLDAQFVCQRSVSKLLLSWMFETKSHRQNDRPDCGIISWFLWTSRFDMVCTSQICVFDARPTFSIFCQIGASLFVQYIYIYMHIYNP